MNAQCEAHTACVCSGPKTYRNRHCLQCNNLGYLEPCTELEHIDISTPYIPSFTMLLDWRRLKDRSVCII